MIRFRAGKIRESQKTEKSVHDERRDESSPCALAGDSLPKCRSHGSTVSLKGPCTLGDPRCWGYNLASDIPSCCRILQQTLPYGSTLFAGNVSTPRTQRQIFPCTCAELSWIMRHLTLRLPYRRNTVVGRCEWQSLPQVIQYP